MSTKNKKMSIKTKKQMKKFKSGDPRVVGKLSRLMTAEQFSRDARHQKPGSTALALGNQIKSETIVCNLSADALYGVMISYVTLALQKGFQATSTEPTYPFYAAQFGWGILNAYATGNIPQTQNLPYWLLCLGQALAPANVPFQQGKIAYSWAIDGGVPADSSVLLGYTPYGFKWNANIPAGGNVDGFPLSADFDNSAYTQELGAAAFSELIQFMADEATGDAVQISKIVPLSTKTGYETNVSAFSVNSLAEGIGYPNIGGFVAQAQLEVPIFDPLFAVFSPNIVQNQTDRFFSLATTTAGDSLFLGGMMSSLCPQEQWAMKRYPKFHAVDFLEFADVLSNWVSLAQTALINDPQSTVATDVGGPDVVSYVCPLTLQEQNLLLRNVIMGAFKDTQPLVQSLYPRLPEPNADEFVPYVASSTTCALNIGAMQLPQLLIENIRALVARWTSMAKPGRNSPSDVQWWIPVLGQYKNSQLLTTDYVYTLTQTGINYPSYSLNPIVRLRKDSKAKGEVREVTAEIPISLVDGNTLNGSTPVLAYINDPNRLKTLEMLWNNWIASTGISNFSSPLGTVGTELGISVLTSVAMTRHWLPNTEDVHHHKIVSAMEGFVDVRLEKIKRATQTVYATQSAVADSSQSIILAAPYEGILNSWILPVNKAELPVGNELSDSTAFPRWQTIMNEPFAATFSAGQVGQNMAMQHMVYAAKMVRTRDAPPSDVDKLIATLAAQGRGGILSGLAASFIGSIFPAAAGIATTVAGALPF